jgi:ribose 1,5-bisphosphokinase PhnN
MASVVTVNIGRFGLRRVRECAEALGAAFAIVHVVGPEPGALEARIRSRGRDTEEEVLHRVAGILRGTWRVMGTQAAHVFHVYNDASVEVLADRFAAVLRCCLDLVGAASPVLS